jgi:RimJ/RimL family protein N-acetyltransferase
LSVIFVIERSPTLGLLRGLLASNFLALLNRFVDFFDFMSGPFFFEIRRDVVLYIDFLPTTRCRFARGEALKQERHPNGYDNSFYGIGFTFWLTGIMREATAALATASTAQRSVTRRNAETKAWAMAAWTAEEVCGSRPAGTSRPASRMTLD